MSFNTVLLIAWCAFVFVKIRQQVADSRLQRQDPEKWARIQAAERARKRSRNMSLLKGGLNLGKHFLKK